MDSDYKKIKNLKKRNKDWGSKQEVKQLLLKMCRAKTSSDTILQSWGIQIHVIRIGFNRSLFLEVLLPQQSMNRGIISIAFSPSRFFVLLSASFGSTFSLSFRWVMTNILSVVSFLRIINGVPKVKL